MYKAISWWAEFHYYRFLFLKSINYFATFHFSQYFVDVTSFCTGTEQDCGKFPSQLDFLLCIGLFLSTISIFISFFYLSQKLIKSPMIWPGGDCLVTTFVMIHIFFLYVYYDVIIIKFFFSHILIYVFCSICSVFLFRSTNYVYILSHFFSLPISIIAVVYFNNYIIFHFIFVWVPLTCSISFCFYLFHCFYFQLWLLFLNSFIFIFCFLYELLYMCFSSPSINVNFLNLFNVSL